MKVLETTPVSSVLFTVDAGHTNAGYEIVGGNTDDTFGINKHGQILTKKALDCETVKSYALVIRGMVPSVPPRFVEKTFSVEILDVNDNSPVFAVEDVTKEMELFIDRYSPKGTIVGKVSVWFVVVIMLVNV